MNTLRELIRLLKVGSAQLPRAVLLLSLVVFFAALPFAHATSLPMTQLPWLHVQGNQIVDQNGSKVLLRGVGIQDPYFLKYVKDHFDPAHDFRELSVNWHVNIIRVPIYPGIWQYYPNYDAELLDPIVNYAGQYGIYILLSWMGHGNSITGETDKPSWGNGNGNPFHGNPYNPNMTLAVSFWNAVAERYKNDPQVIYSVFNEPSYITWTQWRPQAERLVDAVRSHNSNALVLVSGVNYAADLRGVATNPVNRPNVVYEVHPYPWTQTQAPWDQYWGFPVDRYPLFAGEWGYSTILGGTADSYATPLLNYMAAHGVSWTGWCWIPRQSPSLIQSWDYQPTEFGTLIKDALARSGSI